MNLFLFLFVIIAITNVHCINQNDTSDIDFIPTNEWQVVKPHQKLPPGLHIRSNFQTGITEAKFLDKSAKDDANTAISVSDDGNLMTNETNKAYSPDQLKRMLKGIKDESPTDNGGIEINGTKFRSYEELKKDFESMKMGIKTDLEIIRELMDELPTVTDIQRQRDILSDLEYYLHQIDNAQNFVDMGGLRFLHHFMDSAETEVRSEAFRCLSSALQGNAKVKVEAMKNGTLSRLLLQLKSSTDISTINQILVAVSALTRQFPIAQLAFINGGGLKISGDIFDRFKLIDDEKLSIRLVTLITDWLKERNADELTMSSDKDKQLAAEKEVQYKKVDLNDALLNTGWCQRFATMLSTRKDRCVDYLEKLITSVVNVYPVCRSTLDRDNRVVSFLTDARHTIADMALRDNEADNFYYKDVIQLIEDTMSVIQSDQAKDKPHTEL